MAPSYLLALLDARPSGPPWPAEWIADVLDQHLHRRIAQLADERTAGVRLRGWSVGATVGNETFVQARPTVRDRDLEPVEDVLRNPAHCTIAAFTAASDDEAASGASKPALSRFRRWIGVRAEGPLDLDTRRRLRAEVPDFLARGELVGSDGELVFFRFLAALHALGGLGGAYATPELIRRALRTTEALLGDGPLNLMISDGRTLGVIHRGGTLLAIDPPRPPGVRGSADDTKPPRGNLLWFDAGPPSDNPALGAERLAEGIFTIECTRPRVPTRE